MDENGRHGRSLGIPIHQGLDEQEQAGAGGPLNADSSHMADSRQASGRQSAGAHKISSAASGSWREQQAHKKPPACSSLVAYDGL